MVAVFSTVASQQEGSGCEPQFACSPSDCMGFLGFSAFLPQPKNMQVGLALKRIGGIDNQWMDSNNTIANSPTVIQKEKGSICEVNSRVCPFLFCAGKTIFTFKKNLRKNATNTIHQPPRSHMKVLADGYRSLGAHDGLQR